MSTTGLVLIGISIGVLGLWLLGVSWQAERYRYKHEPAYIAMHKLQTHPTSSLKSELERREEMKSVIELNHELKRYDLVNVLWREYDFLLPSGERTAYRIENPVAFYTYRGASTHRVLDAEGIVHIVPAPGQEGCVIRYQKTDGVDPVLF